VIWATGAALKKAAPQSVEEVRRMPVLVQFGVDMQRRSQALKTFLLHQLYRHPRVLYTTGQAKHVVRSLFDAYRAHPQQMQSGFPESSPLTRAEPHRLDSAERVVADYIAGMTDRFAAREHERLLGLKLLVGEPVCSA